jgi:hypothetical protein
MSLSTYAIHWLILAAIDKAKYSDLVVDMATNLYTLLTQVITPL